jgi:cytochrome c-type biogenesis protein
MSAMLLAVVSAFWLGVLTSISPCPLATNIAAISFVGRRVDNPRQVCIAGLLYTLGRMLVYTVLGILLTKTLLAAPMLSHRLQKVMNLAIGPILIIVGMILLELIRFNMSGKGVTENLQKQVERMGVWGAGLLGVLFALSFCPTSAALFFGTLLTLAVKQQSGILIPATYGLATGLPVLVFAILIAVGTNRVAKAYNKLVVIEKWARTITGGLFILIGIYLSLTHIFAVPLPF